MRRSAAEEENDREEHEAEHHDDLRSGKPELGLAVVANGEGVERNDGHKHDCYPYADVDVDWHLPVVDYDGGSRDFVWHKDAERVEVEPAQGETQRSRYVAVGEEVHRASRRGQPRCDLDHGSDDAEDEKGNEAVAAQHECRSTLGKRLA